MRVFILEDERLIRQRLVQMLEQLDEDIQITATADSIESALNIFDGDASFDLAFMDIELGDGQSFALFDKREIDVPVIFTTAHHEFALQAFKVNSIDYLMKPIQKNELEAAIQKFKKLTKGTDTLVSPQHFDSSHALNPKMPLRFLAKTGTRLMSIPAEHIAYFYTKQRLQFIKTLNNDDLMIDMRLDEIEAKVDGGTFFRANRQFILNYNSIKRVHCWFSGKLKVEVHPLSFEDIIISRLKASDFKKWLGE